MDRRPARLPGVAGRGWAWLGVSELNFVGPYLIDSKGRLRAFIEEEMDLGTPDAITQFRKMIAALKE
ncbi:hypothetical protein [Gluconobacter japonicus]|uniref:hypothetical protein n=1 Tax=Gluconobacter japonicus TaxID=376620 RepID=UPI000B1D121E|nr:hypothetical protein [Gluconobacter japonicus]